MSSGARLEFDPDPRTWSTLLEQKSAIPAWLQDAHEATGEQLALDGVGPIVATGHQAAVWHPGILAKDLAVSAFASQDARRIHFVADHDANDPGILSYPEGSGLDLVRKTWRALSNAQGIATGAQPTAAPRSLPDEAPSGLRRVHAALGKHIKAPNLAMQLATAVGELAEPYSGAIPRRSVTALLEMPAGQALLARLVEDPKRAAEAYNHALKKTPRAARPLLIDGAGTELPLWRDTPDGRARVRAEQLDMEGCLRPRALLASALMRLGGCDLFVHGTGGALYDRATEEWITNWLSAETAAAMAPRVTASATLLLPLEVQGEATPPELLNRMRNDPLAQPGSTPSPEKARLLAAIDDSPPRSTLRRSRFAVLREWVNTQRTANAPRLETIEQEISEGRELAKIKDIAHARDWPFPLYADAVLAELAQEIQSVFSSGIRR